MEKEKIPQIHVETKEPLLIGGNTYLSLWDFELTQYDLEKAHKELNETEDCKTSCIKELKKKLEDDQTIKYRTDDEFLLRYLRYCKFNTVKAHKRLRKFYSLRKEHLEIFSIPPNLEKLLSYDIVRFIPYTDEKGRIIAWLDSRKWKPEDASLVQLLQLGHLIMDLVTVNPKMQINGSVSFWDFRGVTTKHILPIIYPRMLLFLAKFFEDTYPLRISYAVGIHTTGFVREAFKIARAILKPKVFDRIRLIGSDMTELHKYVNPALLPKEYGGTIEESECIIAQDILQNLPYLEYENSFV